MIPFLLGAATMAALVAAVFFLRFYRDARDRFFLMFAAAFCFLALDCTVVAIIHPHTENLHLLHLVRLLTFLTIIVAIVDKNRRPPAA